MRRVVVDSPAQLQVLLTDARRQLSNVEWQRSMMPGHSHWGDRHGIATGATARAAIGVVRAQWPGRLVLAVPVVQPSVAKELEGEVDELVYVLAPGDLYAIGVWYDHFPQLSDEDVRAILARHAAETAAPRVDESVSSPEPTTRAEA